ncbi:uncharacterized protein PpBr36_10530 [Pyricularia pennisetigena]|uniref:uncharacterized protein n=1 Tax=Pyricularia pennisetigena TaxID=1578925 RepID=UPI00114D7308|nr:uncharacterized protein PpBr36_10530 [Pyricularia pennisetigena]TLS21271.1 hypothetical protein PpBr36_10530 [Pyricularia pennisetigena]
MFVPKLVIQHGPPYFRATLPVWTRPSEPSVIISSSSLIVKQPPGSQFDTGAKKQKQNSGVGHRTQYRTRTRIDARGVPTR